MPRPTLTPGVKTVRINFKVPETEAGRYERFARESAGPGEDASVSAAIRREMAKAIKMHERRKAGKFTIPAD